MAAAFAEAPPIAHALGGSLGSALALLVFYPLERARIELQSQASSASPTSKNSTNDRYNDKAKLSEHELESDTADISTNKERHKVVVVTGDDGSKSPPLTSEDEASWESLEERDKSPLEEMTPSWTMESSDDEDSSDGSLTPVANNKNLGLIKCLLQLQKRGALYQGVRPVITTIFTSQFVFFFMNAYVKRLLKSLKPNLKTSDPIVSLISSCLAGIGNVLLTNPLWVVNMAIITGEAKTNSLWREFWVMVKERGLLHMWNGTSASILLVSNPVIQFFCYEQFKQARIGKRDLKGLAPAEAFTIGALAKAIATVATYPLQLTQTVLRLKDNSYKGTIDCLIQLFRRGGIEKWYTGMRAKLLQTVLTAAFTFLTYEQILGAVQLALMRVPRQQNPRTNLL